jgi:protein TonB
MKRMLIVAVIILTPLCGTAVQKTASVPTPIAGANVTPAKLIHRVDPLYPESAKSARLQGTVVLDVMISEKGKVESLKLVSGEPALAKAATKAVRKWRYQPALINGKPAAVPTQVTLKFALSAN